MNENDLYDDVFFNTLGVFGQVELVERIRNGRTGPGIISETFHGKIKKCSGCDKLRITSCYACECGQCYTCGYVFRCDGPNHVYE